LQLVASTRGDDEGKAVDHAFHRNLGLTNANGFDDHYIEPGCLAAQHCLSSAARDSAEGSAGGRRPDERFFLAHEFVHTSFVAQDRSSAERARWVDGQDRHPMAGRDEIQPERFDEGGFSCTGRSGNSDAYRSAGVGDDLGQQLIGLIAMIGAS
jgi:hypothetical protein